MAVDRMTHQVHNSFGVARVTPCPGLDTGTPALPIQELRSCGPEIVVAQMQMQEILSEANGSVVAGRLLLMNALWQATTAMASDK